MYKKITSLMALSIIGINITTPVTAITSPVIQSSQKDEIKEADSAQLPDSLKGIDFKEMDSLSFPEEPEIVKTSEHVKEDSKKENGRSTGTWGTAQYTYDEATAILTVSNGTIASGYLLPLQLRKAVQKIIFEPGATAPANFGNGLYDFENLIEITGVLDTSNTTNMGYLLASGNEKLEKFDLKCTDTSKVTSFIAMFPNASKNPALRYVDLSSFTMSDEYPKVNIMFANNPIETLILGSRTRFKNKFANNFPSLAEPPKNEQYTGRWTRIEPSSPPSVYESSKDFMDNYDGSKPGTYVWETKTIAAAPVTVNYEDSEGHSIADSITLTGNVGDPYKAEQKEIEGYTFKEVEGNPEGTFTDQPQAVTYIYTKDAEKGAPVTVEYRDVYSKTISKAVVLEGNIGEKYTSEKLDIPGYVFKKVEGNTTGTFTNKPQKVVYRYTYKAEPITVKYVDISGNTLVDPVTLTGYVGDPYKTEQKDIVGYKLRSVSGKPEGLFTDKPQTVTYTYILDYDNFLQVTLPTKMIFSVSEDGTVFSEDYAIRNEINIPNHPFGHLQINFNTKDDFQISENDAEVELVRHTDQPTSGEKKMKLYFGWTTGTKPLLGSESPYEGEAWSDTIPTNSTLRYRFSGKYYGKVDKTKKLVGNLNLHFKVLSDTYKDGGNEILNEGR